MVENIFGYFLSRPEDTKEEEEMRIAFARWFSSAVPEEEFEGSERLIHSYIDDLQHISSPITVHNITLLMDNTLQTRVIKTKTKVQGTEELSINDPLQMATLVETTKGIVSAELEALYESDTFPVTDFPVMARVFFHDKRNERIVNMYTRGFQVIQDKVGDKAGVDDAYDFTEVEMARIGEVYDVTKLRDLGDSERLDKGKFRFITDFGLETIDRDSGGIYSGQLFGLEGAPGSAKTRFALGVVTYRAAVVHKRDVAYFAIEQGEEEVKAMLVSKHLFELYKLRVSDKMILTGHFEGDEEMLQKIAVARYDLFESGNYGKIHIVEGNMYLDDFVARFRVIDKVSGPFDLFIVDYMYMFRVKNMRRFNISSHFQIVQLAYQEFKAFLREFNRSGFAVNQLNKEGTIVANADGILDETMAAGGMEVYRSTDYNLAFSATETMKAQRLMSIQNPKVRGSLGFTKLVLETALDVCSFGEKREVV